MSCIAVEQAAVELGGRPVLRGVDLGIEAGQVVALLGANGSGKSTLIRLALGLVPAARGGVRLFGEPLDRFRDWHRIGFVPQRAAVDSGVPTTVREVVVAGRLSRRRLFRPLSRADRTAVREALETVGLADRAGDGVATLSGGQQQRVMIARALAGEPELLVLDEPTAGVDVESQEALAAALAALIERGATVLLVAHELGPLAGLVDRALVMRDGRLVYDGPPLASFTDVEPHAHHAHDLAAAPAAHGPGVLAPLDAPEQGAAAPQDGRP